jgi:hypothetical protein
MFRIVFWDVLPCKVIVGRRFRGVYCLWKVGRQLFYTAVHPRRQFWTSYSPPWELEISHVKSNVCYLLPWTNEHLKFRLSFIFLGCQNNFLLEGQKIIYDFIYYQTLMHYTDTPSKIQTEDSGKLKNTYLELERCWPIAEFWTWDWG